MLKVKRNPKGIDLKLTQCVEQEVPNSVIKFDTDLYIYVRTVDRPDHKFLVWA